MKKLSIILCSLALLNSHNLLAADTFCNAQIKKDYTTSHFISLDDGTVKDIRSGLVWSVCSLGQTWSIGANGKDVCSGQPTSFATWQDALIAVQTANESTAFAANDWRLPNIKELDSIVDRSCYSPAINQSIFPNTYPVNYYSSTPYNGSIDTDLGGDGNNYDHITSRIIDFNTGLESPHKPESQTRVSYSVRVVRCGEWPVPDVCKVAR
ncbi:DUF1566 domain-containing protein [Motilimonas pumila]|nr:DUF1566 domain-containing protein [Motilimonas pumila]